MRRPRIRTRGALSVLVVLAVVLGSVGLLGALVPVHLAPPSSGSAVPAATVHTAASPVTHGDLVVAAGETYTILPTLGGTTYYQGGNITVDAGGTLIVQDVTLSFVQYVADSGTAVQRLSHIYHFSDAGTVAFTNATLTTDVQVVNSYAKLNLTVTGSLSAWNSVFAFPGWIDVAGSGAVATLNSSTITWNPNVAGLFEPSAIQGDTLWAPTVLVTGGAKLSLFGSQVLNTYADNMLAYGTPRPTPLIATGGSLPAAGKINATVQGPSDSANLTLDWAYPAAGAESGYAEFTYNNSNALDAVGAVVVWYAGTSYALGSVTFLNNTLGGTAKVPFSGGLLAAISAAGMLNYLNYTGDFGVGPARIAVQVTSTSGPGIVVSQLAFQMNTTGPTYDLLVTGAGSELSAVDTAFDINWNPPAASPYSQSPPYPWSSNKLDFTNGAVGYLANVSTLNGLPGVFSSSAVLPDPSSQVYFYRWAEFNLTGRAGILAVEGAQVSTYYAYNTNQSNNQTANSLNDLAVTDPAIWGYVQYWDAQRGITTYAQSNAAGQAFVLVAAGNLTGPTLPDGIFLGSYHIGITVSANAIGSRWFNWSVSPYPVGVASGTSNYQGPDVGPPQSFANYYGAMSFTTTVTANGTLAANASLRIGQGLGIWITASDLGTAAVRQVGATLYYNASGIGTPLAVFSNPAVLLTTPNATTQFNVTWTVTDAVTGLNGTFTHPFLVVFEWNNGNVTRGGGTISSVVRVTIEPSQIRIVSATTNAPSTLDLTQSYSTSGVLQYNGTHPALIQIYAIPTGGSSSSVEIGYGYAVSGVPFTVDWTSPLSGAGLSAGTTYTIEVTATYNGKSAPVATLTGTFTVPSPSVTAQSFLTQVFFGLPLWAWLAVAAAIVLGLVGFLLIARRQAAGKLVECGECGNLIPEEATVCPKCGAEFEADLIRCSRCAATIPADSKYCPECAAQLLGKPGEGGEEAERQGYSDFTEKYRAEAKRELGENYSEGAFWDWWKRQPTYTAFGQWKLQQGQGTPRTGMTAPPASGSEPAGSSAPTPRGGAKAPPPYSEPATAAAPPGSAGARGAAGAPGGGPLKPCPNCGKEIPPEYLVCPFCGAVTQ